MNTIDFFKVAFKDYKVGAISPSSKYLVKKVINEVSGNEKCILEYGAGSGVVTKSLLNKLEKDSLIYAAEINPDFARVLGEIKDTRLKIIKDDVLNVRYFMDQYKLIYPDLVISSIPLTFFNREEREKLVKDTESVINQNGKFVIFQYSTLILPVLKKYFKKVKVSYEARNFPPCFIMTAYK